MSKEVDPSNCRKLTEFEDQDDKDSDDDKSSEDVIFNEEDD